ncbi:MAG: SulP family inorganic anion transporter [Flavobacteriaceae bacterium]|tara:strand:+ start:936 stop:2780 length:1845 start_codon:yes stop_codon:yes gene_type:complete
MNKLFSNIKGDAFGGVTAGIVALPLALAFGVSSGLGPSAGLYGAIFISFFAALFGGTNTQISGPTAPMTAVSMVIIAGIIAANDGDVNKALPSILMVFLLAGLMQIGLGVLGLGKYIKYIPYPVVSGFMTAIGLIILLTQIQPSLGYAPKNDIDYVSQFKTQGKEIVLEKILKDEVGEGLMSIEALSGAADRADKISDERILAEAKTLAAKEASGTIGAIKTLPNALSNINFLELLLSLATIFIIYGFKRITSAVPSTLVALIVVSSAAFFLGLDYTPIEKIPEGLPIPQLEIFSSFSFSSISPYIITAFTLSLLGAIDSLLTSVVADNMTKTKHNSNKELVGQGIGNSIAAVFGGIPGAGATIRTVVNIQSGGKTRLSGMIAGVLLLFILLALGPIASKIPAAVLSGILITVGIGVMDYKGLKAIPVLPKDVSLGPIKLSSEVLIMLTVLLLSTFWDLIFAVGIGLLISCLMFMKLIGDSTAKRSNLESLKEEAWPDEKGFPVALKNEVYIKHVKGPLFFGYTSEFQEMLKKIPDSAKTVVFRLSRMQYMDQTGLYVMEDALRDLKAKGVNLVFVGLLDQPRYMMERIDIIPGLVAEDQAYESFKIYLKQIAE